MSVEYSKGINMKIGSVVKLVNPLWHANELYRNALGIVLRIHVSKITDQTYCIVRFTDKDIPLTHYFLAVYQHEVKLIKE